MLKILMCIDKKENAQIIYKKAYDIMKKSGLKCELAYASDAEQLVNDEKFKNKTYDIYMLDGSNEKAVKYAAHIRKRDLSSSIIFFGFKLESAGALIKYRPSYIVKNDKDLFMSLRWCCNEQLRARSYFTVKNRDIQMRVDYKTIVHFESHQRVVAMHTSSQVIEFYAKLVDVYALLPRDEFVRCHQSYIVNMSKIKALDKANRCFVMQNGNVIEISKSHYTEVAAQYEKYLSVH